MRHASLFSGIGGFDLAAQWMGWGNVFQVEIDNYCRKVLTKNFPLTKRYGDIKEFDGSEYRGSIDILSGGFPCQPYSTAGKRLGKEDSRHLWPEMLRTIREVRPSWVVGENVRGLTNWNGGVVFDEVQSDLETEGYEVTPFLLPACAVDAPHQRFRIWLVAHSCNDVYQAESNDRGNKCSQGESEREHKNKRKTSFRERVRAELNAGSETIANTNSGQRREGGMYSKRNETAERYTSPLNSWDDGGTWKNFPTQSPVCRGNDGIPNRVDRIKSLGNAIVPQVAYEIFKAISSTLIDK